MGELSSIILAAASVLAGFVYAFTKTADELAKGIFAFSQALVEATVSLSQQLAETPVHILTHVFTRKKKPVATVSCNPPKKMQLMLRFALKPKDQEAILGDMEELFHRVVKNHGHRTGRVWYVWQALRTVSAQLVAKLMRWGVVAYISDTIRRIVS